MASKLNINYLHIILFFIVFFSFKSYNAECQVFGDKKENDQEQTQPNEDKEMDELMDELDDEEDGKRKEKKKRKIFNIFKKKNRDSIPEISDNELNNELDTGRVYEPNKGRGRKSKRKPGNEPYLPEEKEQFEGQDLTDEEREKVEELIEKYQLTDEEKEVKSMHDAGEPLNKKGRKVLKKAQKKFNKFHKKVHKLHIKRNYKIQTKEVEKKMKKHRKETNRRMRRLYR